MVQSGDGDITGTETLTTGAKRGAPSAVDALPSEATAPVEDRRSSVRVGLAKANLEVASEIAGGMAAVRHAAHDAALRAAQGVVEGAAAKGRARARSSSKTRKSARTRERIMTAASEIMVERGNGDFQMSEVSARCRMSKGSLYYYFADKDELVDAIYESACDDLVVAVEGVVARASTASESLVSLCAEVSRRVSAGSPLALALTRELASSNGDVSGGMTTHFMRIARIVSAQLERGKAEGIIRKSVNSDQVSVGVLGGYLVSSLVSAGESLGRSTDAIAAVMTRDLLDVVMNGIGAREGA
ncbi:MULTISPECIES: TetR/AcrR family transcriptional regulator [Atopobiaceae]|uniref:Transcriptional regulator, TetR family n=1 Tax=Parafannyhessea umbonata TaxID=604330 RepID=A0A1H9NIG2_9ACTN|nr:MULTISPECIES: TetR/AcrR family transcriptional regulator [Atopobiaceae]SEH67989.1 transcriptional regulator, TetR family [Parafannyhessea umbonata]SER35754.1 transcriptional regulator, TetR family [Parafannyhessea umbonata]SJZ87994.1 transcriptional regulator, TetR family [Olsenella sp. KH1P3]